MIIYFLRYKEVLLIKCLNLKKENLNLIGIFFINKVLF